MTKYTKKPLVATFFRAWASNINKKRSRNFLQL